MFKKVLKIKRGDLAKEFNMPKVAKKGDVGIDIPVALPYKEGYEDELYKYYEECRKEKTIPDKDVVNAIQHEPIVINPGERKLLPTDIKLEIPKGYWVAVEARSSTSKQSLIVPKGVIDEGYRGEIFAQIINVGVNPVEICHGDRLVQLILQKNETNRLKIKEVAVLSESERGESGFGSSGKSAIG
jgi:dUTP pyrophosphatase